MTDQKPRISLKLRILTALVLGLIAGGGVHNIGATDELSAAIGVVVFFIFLIVLSWT